MTVELDNIIKNLDGMAITLELEKEGDRTTMYIGRDNTSGTSYVVQSVQDVADTLKYYLTNYCMDDDE